MAFDLTELKKARKSDTDLVSSYCREAHQTPSPRDDPHYDIQPCLAFYHVKHEWNTGDLSKSCKVKDDCIKNIDAGGRTCLLKGEILTGIHEYTFKIIDYAIDKFDGTYFLDIAIEIIRSTYFEREKDSLVNGCYFTVGTAYSYEYVTSMGEKYNDYGICSDSGEKCKPRDIVKVIVDLNDHQLSYQVNDEDMDIAFENTEPRVYKIAVYMYGAGTKAQN